MIGNAVKRPDKAGGFESRIQTVRFFERLGIEGR